MRPVEAILHIHRARFCGVFAPDGILKMPMATLLRENHGRRRPFYMSTGHEVEINKMNTKFFA